MKMCADKIRHAAGMLVFCPSTGRIVGFQRPHYHPGLAIPCVFVRDDETPLQAAMRSASEEIGVEVTVKSDTPFVGFDTVGNCMVHVYRGTVGDIFDLPHLDKGNPIPISPSRLLTGPYWHFNARMLRHFGIWAPLVGRFHSHLTLKGDPATADDAVSLIGGKATLIDLHRALEPEKTQRDIMVTHHFCTGHSGIEDEHDILRLLLAHAKTLKDAGFEVQRVKLEHEPLASASPAECRQESITERVYIEIHVKVRLCATDLPPLLQKANEAGWHPSRNPLSRQEDGVIVQFLNKRWYTDHGNKPVTLQALDTAVDNLISSIFPGILGVMEVKYESAVYDSNLDQDGWWMRPVG